MSAYDHTRPFALPAIPSLGRQGLQDGVFGALYLAGGTPARDFFQPLGVTGYKAGLSSRRDVSQRIVDLRERCYASIIAPLEDRANTIFEHPLGREWFLTPLPDPGASPDAQALLAKIPCGVFNNGVITFRLPPGKKLAAVEKTFQSLLAPRDLNDFLTTEDGRKRLVAAGLPSSSRLFTDYDLLGKPRRSLASELILIRPRRELGVLLLALSQALEKS